MVVRCGDGTNLMSQATGGKASAQNREAATAGAAVGEGDSNGWRIDEDL